MSNSNEVADPVNVLGTVGWSKWPVRVHAAGRGQWAFVAGPFSGTGYPTKAQAEEAGYTARNKAIARGQGGAK